MTTLTSKAFCKLINTRKFPKLRQVLLLLLQHGGGERGKEQQNASIRKGQTQDGARCSPPCPPKSGSRGARSTGPPPLRGAWAPSPLSSKRSRFAHEASSRRRSLCRQVQMGSLSERNHLARRDDLDAAAHRAPALQLRHCQGVGGKLRRTRTSGPCTSAPPSPPRPPPCHPSLACSPHQSPPLALRQG